MRDFKCFRGWTEADDIAKELCLNLESIDAIVIHDKCSYVVINNEKFYLDQLVCIRLRDELMKVEEENVPYI